MSYPDDYKRVQLSGGASAVARTQLGLSRQIQVDTTTWTILLMDGATPGGHPVLMLNELPGAVESDLPEGALQFIKDGYTQVGPPTVNPKLLWRASVMKAAFQMLADMADLDNWIVKDAAMPESFRKLAKQITDTNAAVVNGFYRFVPNATSNLPGDLPVGGADQYMMQVITQSSSELTQIIYSRAADGKMWMRSRVGGAWQAWVLANGLTSVDLATRLALAGGVMNGRIDLAQSTAGMVPLRLTSGVAPTVGTDGDLFRDDANGGLRFNKAGSLVTLLDSANFQAMVDAVQFARGQSWVTFSSPTRQGNVTYQNTTAKAIEFNIRGLSPSTTNSIAMETADDAAFTVNRVSLGTLPPNNGTNVPINISAVIPAGKYYRMSGGVDLQVWSELR